MRQEDKVRLRKDWNRLSTSELEANLCLQLEQDPPDGDTVRAIMAVLKQRDADRPREIPPAVEAVWRKFQERAAVEVSVPEPRKAKPLRILSRLAVTAAILGLVILAIPPAFGAKNLFDLMGMWSADSFQFAKPGETTTSPAECMFRTEHAGLRQIHDTLIGLGVTEQVVPTRVPEGYKLTEIKITETNEETKVFATLHRGENSIAFLAYIRKDDAKPQHAKDEATIELIEINDVTHYIMSNGGEWVAAWTRGNVECTLSTNDEKTVLTETLGSIYN